MCSVLKKNLLCFTTRIYLVKVRRMLGDIGEPIPLARSDSAVHQWKKTAKTVVSAF